MKERNEMKSEEKKAPKGAISPELVAKARAGDQDAFSALYEQTHLVLYRSVRSMVRDEDLAWDVLQDSYLRAYQSLDKLEADEAFLPWLRRIAVNEAARQTAKRLPLSFSDLAGGDEGEEDREPVIPDLRIESQPELALDRKETSRLVREILAGLPEQQQLIVGMHYYEDMPIKEIAELLNLAPGTVKAQLFKGRRHVETRVRDLEKQGVKLYGMGPVPFLVALLRKLEPARQAEKKAAAAVLAQAAASGGSQITAMTAGQVFLKNLGVTLLAVAAAASLIVGGKFGYDALKKGYDPPVGPERPTITEPARLSESEAPKEPEAPDLPEADPLPSGICGDDLTWTFDPVAGALTIEGSGDMYDYNAANDSGGRGQAPWSDYREEIRSVRLPEALRSIGSYSFLWCSRLSAVRIPEGVTSIGEAAFSGCGLDAVAIPDSVTHLGSGAFRDCISMRFVTLSEGLSELAENTFAGCTSLTTAAIPETIASIGEGAFRDCSDLGGLVFSGPDCALPSALGEDFDFLTIYGHEGSTAERYAASRGIPFASLDDASNFQGQAGDNVAWALDLRTGSLTFTGSGAMYDDYGDRRSVPWENLRGIVTSVSFPEGLTSIAPWTLHECAVSSVEIPESVTSIGWRAISGCVLLPSLEIPDGVTAVEGYTFTGCSALASVSIPDSVRSIGDSAFDGCGALTELQIPEDVTSIGTSAFNGCSSLTSITIPESLTVIPGNAFNGCAALTTLSIPPTVTVIEGEAFANCVSLRSVDIPQGVTTVGDWAFCLCDNLKAVRVAESVREIGHDAFDACDRLESIMILNADCVLDDKITSPLDGLTIYGPDGCTAETHAAGNGISFVPISDSGKAGDDLFWAFSAGSGTLALEGSGEMYDYEGEGDGCPWREYRESITTVLLPDDLTSIGENAFVFCRAIQALTIPERVTRIGDSAFGSCEALASIVIPESVTEIEAYAFCYCESLTSVTIPGSVSSLGDGLFQDCSSLSTLTISEGVTRIGAIAFGYCGDLTSVTIPKSVSAIDDRAFSSCGKLLTFSVHPDNPAYTTDDSGVLYSKDQSALIAFPGGKSGQFDIPEGVTAINPGAFAGCDGLTSVSIPNGLVSIGEDAFRDCSGLESAAIPDGVSYLGPYAFYGCERLRSITIPGSVSSIQEGTFGWCGSLTALSISEGVTSIGDSAFARCAGLTSAALPDGMISVGDDAFFGCSSMTSVTIPASVSEIGSGAFGWDNDDSLVYQHVADFTIRGVPGSEAERYANENEIPFMEMSFTDR